MDYSYDLQFSGSGEKRESDPQQSKEFVACQDLKKIEVDEGIGLGTSPL
jgi:hypothetical protein